VESLSTNSLLHFRVTLRAPLYVCCNQLRLLWAEIRAKAEAFCSKQLLMVVLQKAPQSTYWVLPLHLRLRLLLNVTSGWELR
jgi:hypothetical protein